MAAAGSGKTETIVTEALALPPTERVLMMSFTTNSTNEIRSRIRSKVGVIPPNITVMTWFSFLLRHGIKPYAQPLLGINGVPGLLVNSGPPRYAKKANPRTYFFTSTGMVHDKVAAEAVLMLDDSSGGAVFARIGRVFDHVFYDEMQDLSARDPEVIERLIDATKSVTLVGDPRQRTYATTQSTTNKGKTGTRVAKWLADLAGRGKITIDRHSHSMRCHQLICDAADALYPDEESTTSRDVDSTWHDGAFLISARDVPAYAAQFDVAPQVLTWDKNGAHYGLPFRNMGDVKGLTFDRVIITPASTMAEYFSKGKELKVMTRAKLYVAITRARHSVAIVVEKPGVSTLPVWTPSAG